MRRQGPWSGKHDGRLRRSNPQCPQRRAIGDAGDGQTLRGLKRSDRGLGERPKFSVDRSDLEAARPECGLQCAHVGTYGSIGQDIGGPGLSTHVSLESRRRPADAEQMRRRIAGVDGEDVGQRRVRRQRRRLDRPPIREHLSFGKASGRDRISLIAAEQDDMVVLVTVVECHVPGVCVRIAPPENNDASAPRLLFQVLAELSVTAGKQAVRTAIAGEAQAGTHEGGAPRRLIVLDFGMACEAIHFEDPGLVHRAVNLADTLELGRYGEPRGRHCI